jgi:hypothetical protein
VEEEIWRQLNFFRYDDFPHGESMLCRLHEVSWNEWHDLSDNFRFRKVKGKLQDFPFDMKADVIYYDAFAPGTQPELWTEEIISRIAGILNPGGNLTTYCAQGEFRRILKRNGLKVEKLSGPVGKREMTRAFKTN